MLEPNIPALFIEYRDDRILDKARRLAKFTLPSLVRTSEDMLNQDDQEVTQDYQSVGALLVNNLAAKIAELLFPSTRAFASFSAPDGLEASGAASKREIAEAMLVLQDTVAERLRAGTGTSQVTTLLKHLIVHGNPVLYRDESAQDMRIYSIDTIALRRDGRGSVIDAIVRENVAQQILPAEVQDWYGTDQRTSNERVLYTRIQTIDVGGHEGTLVSQVLEDFPEKIIGTHYYPKGTCPWIFPVWNLRNGDHYARGMAEDYSADFARLSMLSESSALYVQEALRVLHLVQGGGASVDDVMNAECGEALADPSSTGGGVRGYEVGDYQKVLQARDEISVLVQRLSTAFMYQANVRQAERVTAAEIQLVAREVERSLGGPYANLSASLQVPLAKLLLTELDPSMVPAIVNDVLQIKIVAGIDALGRTAEATQLLQALSETATALQTAAIINQITNIIDPTKVAETMFTANGVSIAAYSKEAEVIKQEAEAMRQAAQSQIAEQPTGPAADATGDINALLRQ